MAEKKEFGLTVGVFAGILNEAGELLIQRRKEKGSVIPGKNFYRDYELPGGGLTKEELEKLGAAAALERLWRYNVWLKGSLSRPELDVLSVKEVLVAATKREAMEEEGLLISPGFFRYVDSLYRTVLVQKGAGKIDIAVCIPVFPGEWKGEPTGEIEWVSPARVKELCEKPKGEQIVSGWGKRMCQMMLWALTFSSNQDHQREATDYLDGILKEKGFYRAGVPSLETVNILE